MAKTYVLDTNVLLHSAKALDSFQDNLVVIPMAVIEELDKFKKNQDELGRNSRQVVRMIDKLRGEGRLSEGVPLHNAAGGKPSGKLMILTGEGEMPEKMDMSIADNRILQVAYMLLKRAKKEDSVTLITKDLNLRLRADGLGIPVQDFECQTVKFDELYSGTSETEVDPQTIDDFYKNKSIEVPNGLALHPNEFLTMKSGTKSAIGIFRGGKLVMPHELPGDNVWNIKPRSREQRIALQLLTDPAVRGLDRVWQSLRYKDYVDQQQLDANKFEILRLLAEREESLDAFLLRLDYLRALAAEPPAGDGLILSTVHSSKGLEYDTVYLLDVLDGILPAQPEPKGMEETKQYQEERRLFYVAMTRARDHLYLFSCLCRSASFIKEIQQNLPVETPEPEDVFGTLPRELFGKRYHHGEKGWGTVLASCEGLCMIAYPDGTAQFLTVGQMYDQRSVVRKIPEKPAAPKINAKPVEKKPEEKKKPEKTTLSPEERAELAAKAQPGRRVRHNAFGPGIVKNYGNGVVTIRFPEFGEKKFVLLDVVRRGLLRFDEE